MQQLQDPELIYLTIHQHLPPRIETIGIKPDWVLIDSVKIDREVSDLNYKAADDILPVRELLHRFTSTVRDQCPYCMQSETIYHIFMECPFIQPIWNAILKYVHIKKPSTNELIYFTDLPTCFNQTQTQSYIEILSIIKYTLWKARNHRIAMNRKYTETTIFYKFFFNLRDYVMFDYRRLNHKKRKKWLFWSSFVGMQNGKLVFRSPQGIL